MDSWGYRKGGRSDKDFIDNIKRSILLEEKYVNDWIGAYTDRRKYRELQYLPWGNELENKIVKENELDLKKVVRPDYLITRKYDGKKNYKTKNVFPLEVQTCCKLRPDNCFIRCHKIDWFLHRLYDTRTYDRTTNGCHILFVVGTNMIGFEKFLLLYPKDLKKIGNTNKVYPNIFQGKPCYQFKYNDYNWKSFNGRTKQKPLRC